MTDREMLLGHLEEIHTTAMGVMRIKRNLGLEVEAVVDWCKKRIRDVTSRVVRRGKNYYVLMSDCRITVNAYSYTIITAHKTCEMR